MMFWITLAAMTVVAVAFIVTPLIIKRSGRKAAASRRAVNLNVYRDRMREIDDDLAAGVISASEADAAKNELAAALVADEQSADGDSPGPAATHRRPGWAIALVLLVLLPVLAGGIYWQQGSGQVFLAQSSNAGTAPSSQATSAAHMVAQLTSQLAKQPDDVQGWIQLGRAQEAQSHYQAAADAFAHANRLSGSKSPEILAEQGQAIMLADHGKIQNGQATQLFQKALKLDPKLPEALFYAGLGAYQQGDYHQAVAHWQTLYQQPDLSAQVKAMISPHLNAARAQIGLSPVSGSDKTAATAIPAASHQPSTSSGNTTETSDSLQIPVRITLAPSLAGKLKSNDTVFVYARAHGGPSMPLAVVRTTVKNIPQTVVLSDNTSMVPKLKLSGYKHWDIVARISRSGNASAAKGDYQAQAELNRSQLPKTLHLNIAKAVE